MAEPVPVALTQLVLWYDATRIQSWPALLAAIPEGQVLSSATEFGRRYGTDRMTDRRHSAAEKITRNLPGLEMKGDRVVLRGAGLFERTESGYRLSDLGAELATEYQDQRDGQGWVRLLARVLLTREPRTRVLIGLLSEGSSEMVFDGSGWFKGSLRGVALRRTGASEIRPFSTRNDDREGLHQALAERAWWSLGAWCESELLKDAEDATLTAMDGGRVSLHDIGLALRAACEVLQHVGLLRAEGDHCVLDGENGTQVLGSEVGVDFGWADPKHETDRLILSLESLLPELRSPTGFVVASELRTRLIEQGYLNPDRALAELEKSGRVLVYAEDYGQSRHGTGLYDDPRKQLVKLRLVGEGAKA